MIDTYDNRELRQESLGQSISAEPYDLRYTLSVRKISNAMGPYTTGNSTLSISTSVLHISTPRALESVWKIL